MGSDEQGCREHVMAVAPAAFRFVCLFYYFFGGVWLVVWRCSWSNVGGGVHLPAGLLDLLDLCLVYASFW